VTLKNAKHEAVAQAYIADKERIGWKAYRRVYQGASQHAAENSFSRLMKNDEFATRVKELDADITDKAVEVSGITKARVLEELGRLGFSNMLDYIKVDGGKPYTDFSALTRDQAAAIQEIHVETTPGVTSEEGEEIKPEVTKVRFKLADKKGPLTELGKHLGLFPREGKDADGPPAHQKPQPLEGDRLEELGRQFGRALKLVQGGKAN
jgi:phage terminase small subunit